ncbi:MAG: hypothetical protein PHC85_01960 [Candidatus Pacebacteria bacterium]|nr:hypothetical protein [Candidatus Paceibacterota bacterium]
MKGNRKEEELNQAQVTLLSFLESYNQTIPASFPHASVPILKKFQGAHPTLFKDTDLWSVAQHRKRLMDWLFTYREAI